MSKVRTADSLAREHTEVAIRTIAEIMDDPFAENKDRLRAAETMLDRGHGKAISATIQIPMNRQQAAMLAGMSDEELMMTVKSEELPRLEAPKSARVRRAEILDAHFENVAPIRPPDPFRASAATAEEFDVVEEEDPLLA